MSSKAAMLYFKVTELYGRRIEIAKFCLLRRKKVNAITKMLITPNSRWFLFKALIKFHIFSVTPFRVTVAVTTDTPSTPA